MDDVAVIGGSSSSSLVIISKESNRELILFIQECGMKLEAKEITIATACTLFHRFERDEMVELKREASDPGWSSLVPQASSSSASVASEPFCFILKDKHIIACSCLLLAGKIEENHLNARKLVNVAYRTFFREKGLTSIDEYYAIRSSLMTLELWLLRLVAFQPTLQHPHPYLMCFLKALEDWLPRNTFQSKPISAACWSILRDAYLSSVVIEEKAEHLAVAVIALALRLFSVQVPCDDIARHSWIKAFCRDLKSEHLDKIIQSFLQVYKEKRLPY